MPVRVGAGRERAAIGYGLMRLTGDGVWGPPPNWHDALALLREAYDRGVRVMDSAWYYGPHVTHQLLAEALHPYPDGLVIVAKVGNSRTPERGWAPATSRPRRP
jgi:pyridoxine 4-dehydrogenase